MSNVAVAIALARRQFKVFPIKPGLKFPPLVTDWPGLATTDEEQIRAWWALYPNANAGVHCTGYLVIDCDVKSGGPMSLAALDAIYELPPTLRTITPSGGSHLFYALPEGHPGVPNTVGKLGKGLDVRSERGYVVSAGSEVATGRYRFESEAAVAPAPEWLLAKLGRIEPKTAGAAVVVPDASDAVVAHAVRWLEAHPGAIEGQGGDLYTYTTGCRLRDFGLSARQAVEARLVWNDRRSPPWTAIEIETKVGNAYRFAQEAPGKAVPVTAEDFEATAVQNVGTSAEVPTVSHAAPAAAGPMRLSAFAADTAALPDYLIKGVLSRQSYAVMAGAPGEGKAQPLDEPVLTPDGWRTMGELKVGDYVIGSSGLPVPVTGVFPQGDKPEWEVIFSNGTVVRCCDEHLWTVSRKGSLRQTITTRRLSETMSYTWRVPLVSPVNYTPNRNPLPVDPYLLGALIGDGGCTAYVGFSSIDEDILEEIRHRLPAGHSLRHKGGCDYQIIVDKGEGQCNHVWSALRFLGLAGKKSSEKEIPEEYMRASPVERLLLLQGLMDTDGTCYGSGSGRMATFSVSNLRLAKQVHELVGSLGGVAQPIAVKETPCLPHYSFTFRMQEGVVPFRLARKAIKASGGKLLTLRVEAARPTGRTVPMQCISVGAADRLYVTTGFVLTHNTFTALDMAYHVAAGKPWMGYKVKQGAVLYLPYEGAGGMRKRAQALRAHYGPDDVPFYILPARFNIREIAGRRELGAAIAELPEKPALIVFDTFAHALCGGDENSAQDVGAFNAGVMSLIEHTGACVLVLHHPAKTGTGPRGSGALPGAVDTELGLENRTIFSRKQRDFDLAAPIPFKLLSVQIGIDEDGDAITSCVVTKGTGAVGKLPAGSNHVRAWEVLCELRPTNEPITNTEWHQACQEFCAQRNRFYDVRTKLRRLGLIVIDKDGMITRRLE